MLVALLVGLGGGLLTGVLDAAGAGVGATPAELLLWGAVGVVFARVFAAAPLAVAVPLLVAGLELGSGGWGAGGGGGAGDPLTLGFGASTHLEATEVAFAAAYATWAARLGLRDEFTRGLLVGVLVLVVATDRGLPPLTALGAALLVPNADRLGQALARG